MDIRETIKNGILLFDGAMGTFYASFPGRAESRCELANLDHPEDIRSIHRAYIEAGSRAIRTNTFDVSGLLTEESSLCREIISGACRLAKEAAEPSDAFVFADIGPAPLNGSAPPAQVYCAQADLFLQQGLKCFVAETLPSDEGIPALAAYLKKQCPEAFLLVSFAVDTDGVTREGLLGRILLERAAALPGVDAVGLNCMSGPHHIRRILEDMDLSFLNGKTLSVMPNAGYPTVLGRRVVYNGSPAYFRSQMEGMLALNAGILGGCCGTTPSHIRELCALLEGRSTPASVISARLTERREKNPEKNNLREKLDSGKRVLAVELDPPANDDVRSFLDGVRVLKDAGADAITIADCPVGRPRADSSLLACKIHREIGVEPIPHMTCRDRNLNATKALLLGLSMEGVHNVLLVTGDPIPTEDRDEVRSVFNFNSRKLIRYVSGLADTALSTPFLIFGALNVNAVNFAVQLKLAQEKEDAGVYGFLTQPVHSERALDNLKKARETLNGKILGGIFPVISHKNALFLNNEVTGVSIPEEMVARYEGTDKDTAEEIAVETSLKIAGEMRDITDGYYLMTPFRRVALMKRIMEQL